MAAGYGTVTDHAFDNYKLIFHNKDESLNPAVKQRMVDTFGEVYPKLVSRFGSNSSTTVKFTVDPNYNANPAATSGGDVIFSAKWLHEHPADTDTATHELMHVVQAYPAGNPGWLVEGIADYVRAKYGTNNGPANWSMPNYNSSQTYTDSYRVTARFLTWLEQQIEPEIVDKLNLCLRQRTYNEATWQQLTGKAVNQLWNEYSQNPHLNSVQPSTDIVSDGTYKLFNVISDKALDITQSGTNNGTNVQIYRNNDTPAQNWRIQSIGNGLYKITSLVCGKVLDVDHSGTTNGTNVQIWDDNGSTAQKWHLQSIDGGQIYKLVNVISGKVLDVNRSGTADGTNVQIWEDNGSTAQQWRLLKLS